MEQDQSLMNSNNAPAQLTFLCHMVNPSPSLFKMEFILSYNISTQKIEVVERDKNRKWRAGKSFVPCTSAKKLSERDFVPGRIVQLSQWKFYLIEGDEVTTEYLKEKALKEGRDFDHELSTNQNQF
uniref:DM10 domain-containing protein n=1 Tax=Heterorhabditis bacteriophora TaxID=37862 RepID=A0A1I7WL38_HETBA